ncbi:putative nuclease HARBI1 [Stomoxys calcitrans]|uniref:putative nuclease HARBI1 n=1 Tax=Stomoxys calcitrans TaxID=35570 RepID=UPI0027E349E1|nr:putative nuclease HARBI1 [Stomoxys calcitrans]
MDVLTSHILPSQKSFAVAPIVKLSAALRFFAEGGYQTGIGKDCDVSMAQSSWSKVLAKVIQIFEENLCPRWIRFWRTEDEKIKIALAFYTKHGIPSVDGTHVRIIAPKSNKDLYYNRKGYYSLNVMLVCDHELRIQYVDASHPGACHDSFIWNNSELRAHLEKPYSIGGSSYWLLGDAGYALEPWLMTPHRRPQDGSVEFKFNEVHCKCRNVIERINGVLKNRWRCILGARELYYTPEEAVKIINICCALHNNCISFKFNTAINEVVNFDIFSMSDSDVVSSLSLFYLSVAQISPTSPSDSSTELGRSLQLELHHFN